jgi:hypothetical protein
MYASESTCRLNQLNGEKLSPECKQILGVKGSDGKGIPELTGYNYNREKAAAFFTDNPLAKLLPGGGLASLLAQYMQQQWQNQMVNVANATNTSGSPAVASSNASRQSSALDSSGESWGAPTVGAGGGNAARGFQTGGW